MESAMNNEDKKMIEEAERLVKIPWINGCDEEWDERWQELRAGQM
jgi:hypothetical protein